MKKRILCMTLFAVLTFVLISTACFSASGNYEDNDAWVLQYENMRKKVIPYYTVPTLFKNDSSFGNHHRFPLVVHNNVHYVPIEMFSGLDGIRITNGYRQSFYITNEKNNSYISFDVANNLAITNLYDSYTLETKLFYSTRYIPAQHVADALGIKMEVYSDLKSGVYALRLSDSRAKLSFNELIRMYSPIKKNPTEEQPPQTVTPVVPEIGSRSIYLTFNVRSFYYISNILNTLDTNGVKATFFVGADDILSHPDEIRQIISHGQNIGFLLDGEDPRTSYAKAKENLRLVSKRTTRAVRFSTGSLGCKMEQQDYTDFVQESGLYVWDWNISVADSQNMYDIIYSELYNLSQRRAVVTTVINIMPGRNTAAEIGALCDLVDSKGQLSFAVHSEISDPLTYRKK